MVLSHIEVIAVCGDHHVNSHGCGQHLEVLHVDFTLVLIDVIEGVDKVELRGRNVSVHEQLLHVIVTTLNAQAFALLCHLAERGIGWETLRELRVPNSDLLGSIRAVRLMHLA